MIPYGVIGLFAAGRGGRRASGPRVANTVLRVVAFSLVTPMTVGLATRHPWASLPWCALVGMALLPSLTLHAVLIPLGLPRLAYWFARVSPPIANSNELRGGAALQGALALARRRTADPETIDWLEARLRRQLRVRTQSIVAAGLLAALRGKTETTRLLFYGVEGASPASAAIARRVARSWLVADAAQRGDWHEVSALGGRRGLFRAARWPFAMGIFARRITQDRRAPRFRLTLWLLWLLAPHRRATYEILRRALAVPHVNTRPPRAPASPVAFSADPSELLADALRAHASALEVRSLDAVTAAARAWDAVRSSNAVLSLLARRALALETHTRAETTLTELLRTVEADLAPAAAAVARRGLLDHSTIDASETLAAAMGRVRRETLDEAERMAAALARRTAEKKALHVSGEWMEWGALRRLCDRIDREGSEATRRAAFTAVYSPACDFGVWLFNVREEKLLANGIFRWLADYARAVGDATAFAVLERNVRVGDGL